jgi:chromosome segregation ATPase
MAERNIVRTLRRQLKDAYAAQADEVARLKDQITQLEGLLADTRKEVDYTAGVMQRRQGLILVLQSDRDRLTATIEVLSRRLASPAADEDPTRAGWRAGNAALQEYRDQMKAAGKTAPAATFPEHVWKRPS